MPKRMDKINYLCFGKTKKYFNVIQYIIIVVLLNKRCIKAININQCTGFLGGVIEIADLPNRDRKTPKAHISKDIFKVTDPFFNYTEQTTPIWTKTIYTFTVSLPQNKNNAIKHRVKSKQLFNCHWLLINM